MAYRAYRKYKYTSSPLDLPCSRMGRKVGELHRLTKDDFRSGVASWLLLHTASLENQGYTKAFKACMSETTDKKFRRENGRAKLMYCCP